MNLCNCKELFPISISIFHSSLVPFYPLHAGHDEIYSLTTKFASNAIGYIRKKIGVNYDLVCLKLRLAPAPRGRLLRTALVGGG